VDTAVPVDRAEEWPFSDLEDLDPSFHRPLSRCTLIGSSALSVHS
jgi:hypothetical protein